ncbi:Quinol monooxygenase YgiN [Kaistia soli DSM 19436]|uniref:Quinol monooxygenase YgiN n=1 Tax=Kaistia soli DSM 19436 TaxID=1122133 RepID=A0A1M5DQP0_9HYPH|nr:antibiotic biosynthesis monooxygenase [Kaistia soli]SHF69307.1 Quinol monooxygenase YgiN [Kaistia soli DSM 19436]
MIVRIAELEIEPVHLDRYRILLAEEIELSIAREAGVLALQAVSLKGEPAQIRILEVYADQQAYEDHLRSPHFLSYKAETAGMVRALHLVETDPIRLAVKGQLPDK